MNEKVTIIMSAYNHGNYIEQAIQSILKQTYKDTKIVAADDASTDNTVDILMKYEKQIDEIHLYDVNSGHGRNRDLVLNVQSEYTALMNSDDCWDERKLEKQVKYMEEHPECGACFTWCNEVDEYGNSIDLQTFQVTNRSKEEWMFTFWKNGNCLAHPSILIRTELYQELYRGNIGVFRQLPDFYMWMRLIQKWEIHIIEENLVRFCHHVKNENVSAATVNNSVRNDMEAEYIWYKMMKEMDESYFKKAFKSVLMNPCAESHQEIMCEKYFVLCISPVIPVQSAAVLYYYDVFEDISLYDFLCNNYKYTNKEFFQKEVAMGKGKVQIDLLHENDSLTNIVREQIRKIRENN